MVQIHKPRYNTEFVFCPISEHCEIRLQNAIDNVNFSRKRIYIIHDGFLLLFIMFCRTGS